MKKTIVALVLCFMIMVLLTCSVSGQPRSINTGDYVELGSYMGSRILWRVMELKGSNPLLWSENVLCAKCFDAAESGKLGQGLNDAEKWGSNLWSKSNLRQWLNTAAKVNWTTCPPVASAIQGKNNYENEPGFLTGFSKVEQDMLVPTERNIIGHYFHREVEMTKDLVFLPTYEEVKDGGDWGLNDDESRTKFATPALMAKNLDMALNFKKGFGYQYFLMTPDDYGKYTVQAVDFGGGSSDQYSACHSGVGVVPAVQINYTEPKSGDGRKKNPWKL